MPPSGAFQLGGSSKCVTFTMITDGLSDTILAGEKTVSIDSFGRGYLDCSTYDGDQPACSTRGGAVPTLSQSPRDSSYTFGSYHPGVCQFVFGDGHVEGIRVSISPDTLAMLLTINDGCVIPDY
jgi:prepilin-type processing-associated H-X9-DG protein